MAPLRMILRSNVHTTLSLVTFVFLVMYIGVLGCFSDSFLFARPFGPGKMLY